MASKADSSFLAPLLTQELIKTKSKTTRKRSAVETWEHARPPQAGEPEFRGKNRIFYCKYCTDLPYSAPASNNFRSHLESKHGIKVESTLGQVQLAALDQLKQLYTRATSIG